MSSGQKTVLIVLLIFVLLFLYLGWGSKKSTKIEDEKKRKELEEQNRIMRIKEEADKLLKEKQRIAEEERIKQDILKRTEDAKRIIPHFIEAQSRFENYLELKRYFKKQYLNVWTSKSRSLKAPENFQNLHLSEKEKEAIIQVQDYLRNGEKFRQGQIKEFVDQQLASNKCFFDKVLGDNIKLEHDQRTAILHEEENVLVLAGAGTGKTTTIIGKVAYLLNVEKVDPERILVLSFTKDSQEELYSRIAKLNLGFVKVRTFHSLGNEILGMGAGQKPDIVNEKEIERFFQKQIDYLFSVDGTSDKMKNYFSFCTSPLSDQNAFQSLDEYYKAMKNLGTVTLNGEYVKSFEELIIANFLFMNGIEYVYEDPYKHNIKNSDKKQYRPDFYLPKYDIYIEHFALTNANRDVPSWFREKDGVSAKQIYNMGIDWKRGLHTQFQTTLLETYSYERSQKIMLINLKKKLQGKGVQFTPITSAEFLLQLKKLKAGMYVSQFARFCNTFKSLMKSNGYTPESLNGRSNSTRTQMFLEIFSVMYSNYSKFLEAKNEIDFEDMIQNAKELVDSDAVKLNFKYIIVDEFQDISLGRYQLLNAIINQQDSVNLFCVGDDWQSIYRFTGSDITLTTKFEEYFGDTFETTIAKTFRFSDVILNYTSEFIMKNPFQKQKNLISSTTSTTEPFEIRYTQIDDEKDNRYMVDAIEEILSELAKLNSKTTITVFIIGRYTKDIENSELVKLKNKFHSMSIELYTAHRTKGLTCDYAIITNVTAGVLGFPNELVDDPILDLILSGKDHFRNAEERRLFYVASTRARLKNYYVTDRNKVSSFLYEIGAVDGRQTKLCTECRGIKIPKSNKAGQTFWACENFPLCR